MFSLKFFWGDPDQVCGVHYVCGVDCVDHTILLQRVYSVFGLTDVVLQWIVIPVGSRATGRVQWSTICNTHTTGAVWSYAGICVRSAAVCFIHS